MSRHSKRKRLTTGFLFVIVAIAGQVAPAMAAVPTITTFLPAHNATNVALNANIVLTFSENVTAQSLKQVAFQTTGVPDVSIPVTCTNPADPGCNGNSVTIAAATVTINPGTDLTCGKTYTLSVQSGAFKNSGDEDFAGLTPPTYSFATAACGGGGGGGAPAPTPLGVAAISTPIGTYGIGQTIPIAVCFSNTVTVTLGGGRPNSDVKLRLNSLPSDGSGDIAYSGTRANCGSGTNNGLQFNYLVAATDTSQLNLSATHLLLSNSAQLTVTGNATALTAASTVITNGILPNYSVSTTLLIATNFTTTTANGWYKNGDTAIDIVVTLNQAATHIAPAPALQLNSGGIATYLSGSGTDTYTFRYTIGSTDTLLPNFKLHVANIQNANSLRVGGSSPSGISIVNSGAYNANGTLSKNKTIYIDNTAPAVMGANPPTGLPVAPILSRDANLLVFFDGSESLRLGAAKNIRIRAADSPDADVQVITTGTAVNLASRLRVGNTVTFTTSTNHGVSNGESVSISGVPDVDCNGIRQATVTGLTTFTITVGASAVCETAAAGGGGGTVGTVVRGASAGGTVSMSQPGQLTINFARDLLGPTAAVTAATRTGSTVVYTTDAAHGFKAPLTPTSIARSGNTITITVASHGLVVGDQVTLTGATGTIAGLNGDYTVATAADSNTITVTSSTSGNIADPTSGYGTLSYRVSVSGAGTAFNTAADNKCLVSAVASATTFTCTNTGPAGTQAFSPAATAGTQLETGYFVIYDAGLLVDGAANPLAGRSAAAGADGAWQFKTGIDRMKPMAVNNNASQYFSTTGSFRIDFTETMAVGTGDGVTPTISPAAGTVTTSVSGTTGVITFAEVLAANTNYTLTVPLGAFTDTSGNVIAGSSSLTFTFSTNTAPSGGGGGGGGGGGSASCGPPPLPPCNVGPGLNFGPGGMIQNPGAIAGGDMANLRPDNFMGFRPDDARNLGSGALQNFRPDQFGALPPTAMGGFDRNQINNLNPAAMAGMNQNQLRALPPEAMQGFRPDQMAQLPPSAMAGFDAQRVGQLPPSAMAGFNANQMQQLPPAAFTAFDQSRMSQLPPSAMGGFNANQMQQLPPSAMQGFNANQMAQLPPSAMAGFDPTKMQQLPPSAMAGFKPEQMQQLPPAAFTAFDPTKVQNLPPAAMAGFDATRMGQMPPAAMQGFKPDQFAQLPPAAMAAFDPTKMQQLPPAAVAGFKPEQMAALPPEAMRVFDPSKMQQLPPAAMAGFDPTKMQALPPTAMAVMNPNQLNQMPPAAFGAIQQQQFNVLPPTAMQGFKPELMAALPPTMVQNFKPEQFAALPPAAMGGLNEDRFRALPPQAMTAFNPQQMGSVPPQAMEGMRFTQMNVIPPTAMQGFKPEQFAALPPQAMQGFKPEQFAALPPQALAGMEPEQLRALPPQAARSLNPQQVTQVPPQAMAAILPGVFRAFPPAAIAALTPEQRNALPPQALNPPPLAQPATAGNIGAIINSISGWNIDKVPAAAFTGMRPADVAKLPSDAFNALSPQQLGSLPAAAIGGIKPAQMSSLPPEAIAAFKPTQLGALPPTAIAAMTPAQLGALPPAAMSAMKPAQAGQLPPEAFEAMKPTQLGQLPPAAFGALKPTQVESLPPEAMAAMKPTQLGALPPNAFGALAPEQVAALPPAAMAAMKPTQAAALPVDAIAEMKPTQVGALPPAAVGGFKPEQVSALPPEAMAAMKPTQVAALKPAAMVGLEPEQVDALPPTALRQVSDKQLGAISPDAMKSLDTAQINALPSAAFKGMKPDQANALSPDQARAMQPADVAQMPPAVRTIVNNLKAQPPAGA